MRNKRSDFFFEWNHEQMACIRVDNFQIHNIEIVQVVVMTVGWLYAFGFRALNEIMFEM